MHHTFISYAREDINTAKKIVKALKENNLDIWVDWQDIPNAQDWEKAIFAGIEHADAFLFLISIDSVTSKICNEEIEYARKNGKRIIPVVISNAEEEKKYKDATDITDKLIYRHLIKLINGLNFIFCREHLGEFLQSIEQIKTTIRTDYEWLEKHTNLQLKALEWEKRNKKGGLLSGTILRDAQEQLAHSGQKYPQPTDLQKLFINESQKAETRTRSWILTIAGIVIAALAVLSLYANNQRLDAINSEATAQAERAIAQTAQVDAENQKATAIANENIARSGELAAQAVLARDISFDLSMLLSIEAFRKADTIQSKSVLFDNTQLNPYLSKYLFGHQNFVENIEFSPDGNLLASSDNNGEIILWDTNTGKAVFQIQTESVGIALAFSQNGKILASSIGDSIYFWDTKTLSEIGITLTDTDFQGASNIIFGQDDQVLAAASDNTVFIWSMKTHQARKIKSESFGEIASIAFSPDGNLLAVAGLNPYMFLLNATDLQVTGNPMDVSGWTDSVSSLEFNTDGSILASGDASNFIILWDVKSQKPISSSLTDDVPSFAGRSFFGVDNLSLFADGAGLIAISSSFSNSGDTHIVNSWRIDNLSEIRNYKSFQIPSNISGSNVDFNPNGNIFATTSNNGKGIVLWDLQRYGFTRYPIIGSVLASNGETLASDGKINTPNGEMPALRNKDILFWNIENLETMITELPFGSYSFKNLTGIQISEFSKDIDITALSPNGGTLASVDESNVITLWDVQSQILITQLKGHTKSINNLVFNPNGSILASSSDDNTIILWDTKKHQANGLPLITNDKFIRDLAFSPDGKILASRTDGAVTLWDTTTHHIIEKLEAPNGMFGEITFNNKGDYLAFTIDSYTVVLWDLVNKRQAGQLISNLKNEITSLAFINNDKFLVTGHFDWITLWDIGEQQPIGQPVNTGSIKTGSVNNLILRTDDTTLTATGDDFVLLLDSDPVSWIKIACERAGRNFTRVEWAQYFPDEEYRKTCEQWDLESKVIITPTATP